MTLSRSAGSRSPLARRHSRGQSLVEFGLVLPVFMLLAAGMVDFGLGLYSNMTVINGAREGARLGVVSLNATPGQDDPAVVVARVQSTTSMLDSTQLTVTVTCVLADLTTTCPNSPNGHPAWASGDGVKVTVELRLSHGLATRIRDHDPDVVDRHDADRVAPS